MQEWKKAGVTGGIPFRHEWPVVAVLEPTNSAGINAVLNDPPPREAVAALVERFSWEENAARLAEHYERLLR